MARSTYLKEQLARAFGTEAKFASLHAGDPGTTGANEVAGVTRKALTWTQGGVDGLVTSNSVSFTVPADTELTHVGIWSAATGGQFLDSLPSAMSYETGGTYAVSLTFNQN